MEAVVTRDDLSIVLRGNKQSWGIGGQTSRRHFKMINDWMRREGFAALVYSVCDMNILGSAMYKMNQKCNC